MQVWEQPWLRWSGWGIAAVAAPTEYRIVREADSFGWDVAWGVLYPGDMGVMAAKLGWVYTQLQNSGETGAKFCRFVPLNRDRGMQNAFTV